MINFFLFIWTALLFERTFQSFLSSLNSVRIKVMLERAVSEATASGGPAASAKEREAFQAAVASCVRALLGLLSCQFPPQIEDEMTKQLLHLLKNSESIVTADVRLNATLALVKSASKKQTIEDIIEEVQIRTRS